MPIDLRRFNLRNSRFELVQANVLRFNARSMEPSEEHDHLAPKSSTEAETGGNVFGSSKFPHSNGLALRVYWLCDGLTEAALYSMVVFYPWAFGTTQTWSIWAMNFAGYFLGIVLLTKRFIRAGTGYQPARWVNEMTGDETDSVGAKQKDSRRLTVVLATLTILILAYCLVSALNARATYLHDPDPARRIFIYSDCIDWLPHSYDRMGTWFAFWSYLGLALSFWAVRDWLLGKTAKEQQTDWEKITEQFNPTLPHLPARLRRLLWLLFLNSAVLGLVSILQRLAGTDKLLWLMKSDFGSPDFHFGPYNYRANGAQYFNLLWPVCIGFWWLVRTRHQAQTQMNQRAGTGAHVVLLPLAILIGACPVISTNRAGALLSLIALPLVFFLLLLDGNKRDNKHRKGLFVLFVCWLGFSLFFGWAPLEKRLVELKNIDTDATAYERLEQSISTLKMVRDHPALGVGPYAYKAIYQFYLAPQQRLYSFTHNDWLQTLAEWGGIGFVMISSALLIALRFSVSTQKDHFVMVGTIKVSTLMVLLHSLFDFPLQIQSILFTFLLLLAVLISLPPRPHLN